MADSGEVEQSPLYTPGYLFCIRDKADLHLRDSQGCDKGQMEAVGAQCVEWRGGGAEERVVVCRPSIISSGGRYFFCNEVFLE